jgi:hypothetical protein
MSLEANTENRDLSKQTFDDGVRFALNQFVHSVGYLLGKKGIHLDGQHLKELFHLSPREMSDLNILLHQGEKASVVAFLDSTRDATPRRGWGVDNG